MRSDILSLLYSRGIKERVLPPKFKLEIIYLFFMMTALEINYIISFTPSRFRINIQPFANFVVYYKSYTYSFQYECIIWSNIMLYPMHIFTSFDLRNSFTRQRWSWWFSHADSHAKTMKLKQCMPPNWKFVYKLPWKFCHQSVLRQWRNDCHDNRPLVFLVHFASLWCHSDKSHLTGCMHRSSGNHRKLRIKPKLNVKSPSALMKALTFRATICVNELRA